MSVLRRTEDVRTLLFVAAYFALSLGAYVLNPEPLWVKILLVAATCWMSFVCATITHNVVHAPVFRSRGLNRAFQVVLTLAYGHPVSAFVPGHNLSHHLHTQTRRDVMRTTKLRFKWNLLNQLFFLPRVALDITRADMNYTSTMKNERPRWYRQWLTETIIFWSSQIALAIIAPMPFVLYILVPHLFAAWGIVGINFVQHDGCDQDHPVNHSRNLVGPWINWWTFNNGYHGMHHLKPGMHWADLPAGHEEHIKPTLHPNLDVPNFFTYCWKAYIFPGIRVDYLGKPVVLPEEGPDEEWIPGRLNTPEGVSLGAEA